MIADLGITQSESKGLPRFEEDVVCGAVLHFMAQRRLNPADKPFHLPMSMGLAYLLLYHAWQTEAINLAYAGELGNQHD